MRRVSPSATARRIPGPVRNLLFARSGNRCAFPDCPRELVIVDPLTGHVTTVGQIAHIVPHSDSGPRATMPEHQRREEPNLILLCRPHHTLVDAEHAQYSVETLRQWKRDQARWAQERQREAMAQVRPPELESVLQRMATSMPIASAIPEPPDIRTKILRNMLDQQTAATITMGLSQAAQVKQVIQIHDEVDFSFSGRLVATFQERFQELSEEGLGPNEIFSEVIIWAAGQSSIPTALTPAIAITSYLFHTCDVFE